MSFDIAECQGAVFKVTKSGQQVTTDAIRKSIIDGKAYYAWDNSWNQQAIVKDSSWNVLFYSGGTKSHKVKLFAEVDASTNYRVFEVSTLVATPVRTITPRNYNRNYTDNCAGTMYKGNLRGNVSHALTTGTEIRNKATYASNTTGPQGRTSIGDKAEEYSFITHPSKYYLLHIYNRGPNTLRLHVHIRLTEYNEALTS